jgi:putative membrane protein
MILYNGKKWREYMRLEGTVILKAMPYAILMGIVAAMLKHVEEWIGLSQAALVSNSAAYSGFTFTLGFVLVFRSSQCYHRFWTCAQSACTMRAQLAESASSLITFSMITKASKEEVDVFVHTVIRLFSLLHALALQHIADKEDENFITIDSASLGAEHLGMLAKLDSKGRVDLVYQWIGALIMNGVKSGLLSVPPPILSRVFQEMEKGMVEYHQVLQIMSIPFPFPYAQVSVLLLVVYMGCTPVVMVYYVGHPLVAAGLTFISVLCLVSIELIASELENPLGDDANDLPCHEWQTALNESLLGLLHPEGNNCPSLLAGTVTDHSLLQTPRYMQPVASFLIEFSSKEDHDKDGQEMAATWGPATSSPEVGSSRSTTPATVFAIFIRT